MAPTATPAPSRQRRRPTGPLVVLGGLLLVPSLAGTVMRLAPPSDDGTALLASFIAYAAPGYALALVCWLTALATLPRTRAPRRPATDEPTGGRRLLTVVAAATAVLLALHVAWLAPLFHADDRPAGPDTFVLLSQNLRLGLADPDALTALAARADVVVLAETTPPALDALSARGWGEQFPYQTGHERPTFPDTAVYSRFPLRSTDVVTETLRPARDGPAKVFAQRITTVEVPGVAEVRLMPVHPCNPYCGGGRWTSEHDALRALARANLDQPLVVAGDFNAVDDHGPMLDLRHDGLRSATDLTGAGWLPTYPAGGRLPPLLPIDHVLVSERLTATAIETVRLAGTDHLGLLATLAAVTGPG